MITILLGIISSTLAEVVTAINKRLQGTVLQGDAAFLIAFGMAMVGAIAKEVMAPGFTIGDLTNWQSLVQTFGEVFAVSQVYFIFVVEKLHLDVQSAPVQYTVVPAYTASTATDPASSKVVDTSTTAGGV